MREVERVEVEVKTVYVIGDDSFMGRVYDTGIRLVKNDDLIERTFSMLYRSTTSTTFQVVDKLPEDVEEFGSVLYL